MIYALFRQGGLFDLYCAVPHDQPVPSFVCAPVWEFVGTSTPDMLRPDGFHEEAARFACQFQGFYTYRTRPRDQRSTRI